VYDIAPSVGIGNGETGFRSSINDNTRGDTTDDCENTFAENDLNPSFLPPSPLIGGSRNKHMKVASSNTRDITRGSNVTGSNISKSLMST